MSDGFLFISHASDDGPEVARIVDYLERGGVRCWISGRDIPPKSIYAEAITQGMKDSSACVVIVSAASNASAAVKRELELASRFDKPFIPIRLDASEPAAGLDYYLNNAQWVDYGRGGERALDRIISPAAAAVYRPQARPAAPPSGQRPPLALIGGGTVAVAALVLGGIVLLRPMLSAPASSDAPASVASPAVTNAAEPPPAQQRLALAAPAPREQPEPQPPAQDPAQSPALRAAPPPSVVEAEPAAPAVARPATRASRADRILAALDRHRSTIFSVAPNIRPNVEQGARDAGQIASTARILGVADMTFAQNGRNGVYFLEDGLVAKDVTTPPVFVPYDSLRGVTPRRGGIVVFYNNVQLPTHPRMSKDELISLINDVLAATAD